MPRRIAYVQFTNPANYPPLIHSAHILAEQGWDVLFIGTSAFGTGDQQVEPHPRIRTELLPRSEDVQPRAAYRRYATHALRTLVRFKPAVVYASDLWSCPVAAGALISGMRVIYHEHDEQSATRSLAARLCLSARDFVAPRAARCVLPNQERAARFQQRYPRASTMVIWNCASIRDVAPPRPTGNGELRLYYHGSIVPDRLPRTVVQALPQLPGVRLRILGYQTIGAPQYLSELEALAREIGVSDRLELRRTRERHHIWPEMNDADVGLALVPMQSDDVNLRTMAAASNKPFDYLARGLALLISDRPEWRAIFEPYAAVCNPDDADSVVQAIKRLAADRARTRALGEAGRQRILSEWNYERQFEPLRQLLHA